VYEPAPNKALRNISDVHGKNQKKVFDELCEAVEEAIQILRKEWTKIVYDISRNN